MVKILIRSLPKDRVIDTNKERPKEASQAPNVRRTINKNVLFWGSPPITKVRKGTRVRIMPSKHKSDIRRCFRCRINLKMAIATAEANNK